MSHSGRVSGRCIMRRRCLMAKLSFFVLWFCVFVVVVVYSRHDYFCNFIYNSISYCVGIFCALLVTSNKNKIKWVTTKNGDERSSINGNGNSNNNKDIACSFDTFLLFASTFSLLIIKSKWMPSILGPMIHFASQFILVLPFIINSYTIFCSFVRWLADA